MNPAPRPPRFEDVYPQCEFAPLVHFAVGLAERILGFFNKRAHELQTVVPSGRN